MLLQFNWDRLDITAAEAIRALVNTKLEEELQRRREAANSTTAPNQGTTTTTTTNNNNNTNNSGSSNSNSSSGGGGGGCVESLCVTSVEWGNTPPFVEVVAIDDAMDFSHANSTSHDPLSSLHGGDGGSEADSTACGSPPTPLASNTAGGGVAGGGGSAKWTSGGIAGGGGPGTTGGRDRLASYVGPGGLYISLHVTYGGSMRLSVSSVLRYDIPLGSAATLPVRMPLTLQFSKMDMDFYLCVNIHHNACRIWMEPGKLSTSPITRMNVMAVFGERRSHSWRLSESVAGTTLTMDEFEASDECTHADSSHIGSEEEEDAVFMDETAISQFVLSEIRAVLQDKILFPHFVVVPLEKSSLPKERFLPETHPSPPSSFKRSRSVRSQNTTMDSPTINSDSTDRTANAKTINSKGTTPRGITQFTTLDAFGLSPQMETTPHLPQNEQKKTCPHSRATSTSSSVDSAVRRLHAIRMKINMANAIVQNAVQNAKAPMTPEERKREMLQLEAAKLIIFVGRQFNIREELQNVLGQAYDEIESIGQFRNSNMSEAPFAPKEAPPDLSLKELRRITAEMEAVLEQEKVKRGKTGKEPQLSANKVNSNLSELLWIIESLELEMPASQYSDIEEEIGSHSLTTTMSSSPMSELLKQRQECKEQQLLLQKQQQQSLSQTKILTPVPQFSQSLDPLASDMTRMNIVVNSSHSSVGESQTSSVKDDKLIAFSVDNESVGCTVPEAAELKLLQFMYDAIAQNEEISEMDANKDKHSQQEVFEEEQKEGNIPLDSEGNLPHSKRKSGHRKLPDLAKQMPAKPPFQIPWNEAGVLKSTVMDLDEEESKGKGDKENEEEMQPSQSDRTGGTSSNRMSMSTMQSTVLDNPSFASWVRPALPTMRVLPMRSDLIEILQKLYENFNYNHHFRQCRPAKESVPGKSQANYAEEMMKRLERPKGERRLKADKKEEEEDFLTTWREKSLSITENELIRKRSTMNNRVSILDEPESSPPLPEKESATPAQEDELPISRLSSTSPPEIHDETTLLSVEVGDGLLFVIKGRGEKIPGAHAKRKKRNNSSTGEERKKIGKGRNSIANSSGRNSLAGDKGKNEKEKGRPGSVSTLPVEADTKKTEPEFDNYTLYAMNHSNKPVSGVVNIDMKKFQNLKLKALLDYTVTKKTITVKLPPHNSQAVLTLHPIKKGKEVLFKDALNFEEEKAEEEKTPSESERASRSVDKGKLFKTPSTGKVSSISTISNVTSTGNLQSTSSPASRSEGEKVSKETKEIKPSIPATLEKDNEKTDTSAVVLDSHGDEPRKSDGQVGKVPIGKDTQHKLSEPEKNLGGIKKKTKDNDNDDDDAENDYSGDVIITKKKSSYRKSPPNFLFPGSIGSELNWGNVLGEGAHGAGGFDDDLDSENADVKGVADSWNTNKLQEPKEGEKEMKQESRQESKNVIPSRGGKDNVDVNKHGRISEVKGTGKAHPVRGTSGNSPTLTPVSEWGKPLKDPKEEALERDRVVKSVLQSSAWPSDANNAAKIAAGRKSEDEKMDAIVDEALNYSGSSSPSQRYPSGRLDHSYRGAEQVVATFLHHIAEEEELGPEYTQDSDKNEDMGDIISLMAYSSSQRHGMQTHEGDIGDFPPIELNQQEKGEGQQASRSTSAAENRMRSGGEKQNQLGLALSSPYLGDTEGKEAIADLSSSSSSSVKHHSTTTGSRLSNEETRTSRSHRQTVDGRLFSTDNSGASGTPVVFCETCAASLRHASDSFPRKGSDSITDAARHSLRVTSGAYWKGTKGSTSVITDIEGEKGKGTSMSTKLQDKSSSTPTKPLSPYDTTLQKLQAQEQDKLQRDSMLSVATKEHEYAILKEEELMTTGRMRVYTETRPGGRVAILVPEKMDTVPVPPSAIVPDAKSINKMTASETKKPPLSTVEMFAQGIRSSLHTNARQVIAHGSSSNIPNYEGSFRRISEKGSKKKSVDGIRYAALPPLSVLYTADTVHEVDDVEAAEEEARNLFMRDPARYDCVVDDLVSRALAKVQGEEEKEREAQAQDALFIQQIVFPSADGLHATTTTLASTTPIMGSRPPSAHIRLELDDHLEQQRRARRIIAYILLEMRRMWRRREMEANVALRAAVDRQIRRARRLAWRVERRRVLGLRAMLNLLDRATGRRRGWIPPIPTTAGHNRNYGYNYNHYKKEAAGDGVMVEAWERGPWRPPMSLARQQRILPIQVVRQHPVRSPSPQHQIIQEQQQQQQHVLLGYKRTLLEPYITPAVRMRHERRTRYAAPFQRPTKRFSPQEEWMDGTPKI
ncbi:hypothetical protein LSM04_004868 [Trypanosoma melophagium]|uniref:uncharacterized protein n=1 Tax=Trypanosoma melophagium TaxID=715481 RepID=UPI003519E342|nr:hypothetical protein LSM04_004868 [Trypanosoma melophagium]